MLLQDIRCDDEKPSDHDWVLVHYYLSVHTWDVDDDQGSAERRYDSALDLEVHSHLDCVLLSLRSSPFSPTAPIDTHRRIQLVCICPAQDSGDRVYKHFPHVWWVWELS